MTTNNHPANGPLSLDRLHQIREILSKAAAQSDGGNLGYAMADAVKVIDGAIAAFGAEPVGTFRKGPCGYYPSFHEDAVPLYTAPPAQVVPETLHNSVIAEQLAHVLSGMEVTDHQRATISCAVDRLNKNADTICQLSKAACSYLDSIDYQGAKELFNYLMTEEETNATVNGWNACRAAMLQAGNSPVTPDVWVACSERMPEGMTDVHISNGHDVGQGWWDGDTWQTQHDYYSVPGDVTHWTPLPAAPQQEDL